ncbi:Aldose reductase A [Colletotrichum siamense]|nr:Aldose reductase A [Colletotrichum siamense]KAF4879771.1 Aldose reductase A [Colletotrichum siamense]
MEKLVDSGKARSIGLSNFNVLKTKRILEVAKIVPAVNQVELHPMNFLIPHQSMEFCSWPTNLSAVDQWRRSEVIQMSRFPLKIQR